MVNDEGFWVKSGSGQEFITMGNAQSAVIPLPPVSIQRRIASTFARVDDVREKRRQANQLTDQFLQSAFLEMFGDPVTNPKGWEKKSLSGLLTFLTSGSRGWAKYYCSKGDIFLRIENVGKNQLILDNTTYVNPPTGAEANRIRVQAGDVLLSITADLGRTCVIPESFGTAYINQHLAILRVKDLNPTYLGAFIASEGGQRQLKRLDRQGVKSGLNFDDIRSINILVPPVDEQQRFVDVHARIQNLQAKQRTNEKELENLFGSLMQRAFSGELV